mmetsp:Transcript_90631/g.166385  ORF Transcript_90631/g.166385 Transcript_90631/m.166385 type:complete len:233 (-) Transcript_90631:235-933(-)
MIEPMQLDMLLPRLGELLGLRVQNPLDGHRSNHLINNGDYSNGNNHGNKSSVPNMFLISAREKRAGHNAWGHEDNYGKCPLQNLTQRQSENTCSNSHNPIWDAAQNSHFSHFTGSRLTHQGLRGTHQWGVQFARVLDPKASTQPLPKELVLQYAPNKLNQNTNEDADYITCPEATVRRRHRHPLLGQDHTGKDVQSGCGNGRYHKHGNSHYEHGQKYPANFQGIYERNDGSK